MKPLGMKIDVATDVKREIGQYLAKGFNMSKNLTWKQHAEAFYKGYTKYAGYGRIKRDSYRKYVCDQYPQFLEDVAVYMVERAKRLLKTSIQKD